MSAYFILMHTVTDQQQYFERYVTHVMPVLAKHKAEVVVGDLAATALQGKPPEGVVVVRFPSEQAIRDFLDDPVYQPLKQVRFDLTRDAHAVMAPEFTMPA
jgi:uncharacterized protein (DUF1330 family)